ncbi:MAG: hypothetical protein Q8P20_08180 [bacterium]|nr:hypothetical protein [bacterium]
MKRINNVCNLILIIIFLFIFSGCAQTETSYVYYRDLALQLNNEGKYRKAIEASEECIRLKDDIDCWIHKANANYHLNNCMDALVNLWHVSMKDPNNELSNILMFTLLNDPKCPELNRMLDILNTPI